MKTEEIQLRERIWQEKNEYKYALASEIRALTDAIAKEMEKPDSYRCHTFVIEDKLHDLQRMQETFQRIKLYDDKFQSKDYTPLSCFLLP